MFSENQRLILSTHFVQLTVASKLFPQNVLPSFGFQVHVTINRHKHTLSEHAHYHMLPLKVVEYIF